VLGVAGPALNRFLAATATAVSSVAPSTMLQRGIYDAYEKGVARIAAAPGLELVASSSSAADASKQQAATKIFAADVRVLGEHAELEEEVFGPSSIVYRCPTADELYAYARRMTPSLTATIHGTDDELREHAALIRILERKVGRIIFNGFPTGLEPCASMHHGGPYPATTHSHYTSVGVAAIDRFVRPVCYQNFPNAALPGELQESNPRKVTRLVDDSLA
jgi:2,5-dioxopentanoate dehydrogenase